LFDAGDEREPTPTGIRRDVRKVTAVLILLGAAGGVALGLLIARLTGML
jgi:hypothetical protein